MAVIKKHRRITAADDDMDFGGGAFDDDMPDDMSDDVLDDDDGFNDQLDDIADDIEDMKDEVDDIQEDDPNIEVDNNIDGHYIAECDRCHGIFISAVSQSDQDVEKITGVCPLCDHETDQYLKWVVKSVE